VRRRLIFNAPALKLRRKQLRNKATEAERILWSCLKKNLQECKFIRQYSVEGYIVDFYCPKKKVAIELDGEVHRNTEQVKYDNYRTRLLNAYGIKLIRFWNWEVKDNLSRVLREIRLVLPS